MHLAERKPGRNLVLGAMVMLVAAALWAAVAPPAATAAPPSNTWDLTTLQTHLDSGPVQGYFLTVLGGATDADQTPVAIPATIESIVPGADAGRRPHPVLGHRHDDQRHRRDRGRHERQPALRRRPQRPEAGDRHADRRRVLR